MVPASDRCGLSGRVSSRTTARENVHTELSILQHDGPVTTFIGAADDVAPSRGKTARLDPCFERPTRSRNPTRANIDVIIAAIEIESLTHFSTHCGGAIQQCAVVIFI